MDERALLFYSLVDSEPRHYHASNPLFFLLWLYRWRRTVQPVEWIAVQAPYDEVPRDPIEDPSSPVAANVELLF
jgi:hypothetical protein